MTRILGALAGVAVRDAIRFFLCSAFAGLSVKIMDDWLDRGEDEFCDPTGERALQKVNLARRLGDASLPYALFSFACAVAFDSRTAVALFLMAYAAGMGARSLNDLYPSGLRGWQESLLASFISALVCGWRLTLVAALCIAAIQGVDDAMDWRTGGARAAPLVWRFGIVEVVALATATILLSLALDTSRTAGVVLGAAFVWGLEAAIASGRGGQCFPRTRQTDGLPGTGRRPPGML